MIMTKENRVVEKGDLIAFDEYAKNRKQFRKEMVEFKKNRRIPIGPYATLYFECFDTMLGANTRNATYRKRWRGTIKK